MRYWEKRLGMKGPMSELGSMAGGSMELPGGAFRCAIDKTAFLALVDGDDPDGPAQFDMVVNSGEPFDHWFWKRLVINLKGVNVGRQDKPVLRDHDPKEIAGATRKIWINRKEGIRAKGLITRKTMAGAEAITLADDINYPWQASMLIPPSKIRLLNEGESAKVNGHEMNGPGAIFEESSIREVSICTLGADENTSVATFGSPEKMAVHFVMGPPTKEESLSIPKTTAKPLEPIHWLNESNPSEEVEPVEPVAEPVEEPAAEPVEEPAASSEPGSAPAGDGEGTPKPTKFPSVGLSERTDRGMLLSERERVVNILDTAAEFGLSAYGRELVEKGVELDVAIESLKDAKLSRMKATAPASPGPNADAELVPNEPEPVEELPLEERCKKEWAENAQLHREFGGSFESFFHYTKNREAGLVRFYQRGVDSDE